MKGDEFATEALANPTGSSGVGWARDRASVLHEPVIGSGNELLQLRLAASEGMNALVLKWRSGQHVAASTTDPHTM